MKNKYRILKIAITLIILGFLLHFSLNRFSEKKIMEDMVFVTLDQEGATPVYFIAEKDIKSIVEKENPSKKVGDIDIPKLEKKIREIPMVDSANVYLNLNAHLHLDIKQKVPVFRFNKGGDYVYIDEKGMEFPTSKNYAHQCMLVSGKVAAEEYPQIIELIKKIESDDFTKKYFVGISKKNNDYYLLTNDGSFQVEIGDLENIDFKIKGFKTFVEKILVYQDLEKYNKISLKYNNQIVTTLNPFYEGNKELLKHHNTNMETPKKPAVVVRQDTKREMNKPKEVKKTEKK